MHLTGITPILNVSDIGASLAWFEKLGWKRCWTYNDGGSIKGAKDSDEHGPANFAAVGAGEPQVFLCRNGQGARGTPSSQRPPGWDNETGGVWMTWWLKTPADVDAAHALALKNGFTVTWPPTDEPWNVRECHIVHPDGHTFRVSAPMAE